MKVEVLTDIKKIVTNPYTVNGKWDGVNWILLTMVEAIINGKKYTIMPGFVTDWGSVPRIARVTVDRMGKALIAFLFHDFFYTRDSPLSRYESDQILYIISRMYEVSLYESNKVYYSVRAFGWTVAKEENRFEFVSRDVIDYVCESNRYWPEVPTKRKMLLN